MDEKYEDNKIIENEEYRKLHDEIEMLEDGFDLSESNNSAKSWNVDYIQPIRNISSQSSMNLSMSQLSMSQQTLHMAKMMNCHMKNNEAQTDSDK